MSRIIAVVCVFIILCGCAGQKSNSPNPTINASDNPEEFQGFIDYSREFSTEEELHEAVRAAQKWSDEEKAADKAKLWNLRYYYVPETIPEGYVLYKVGVLAMDMATFYVPEEYANAKLDLADERILSMISVRVDNIGEGYNNTLEAIIASNANSPSKGEVIDDYYFFNRHSQKLLWEQDEQVMTLSLPHHKEAENPYVKVGDFSKEAIIAYGKAKRVDIEVE